MVVVAAWQCMASTTTTEVKWHDARHLWDREHAPPSLHPHTQPGLHTHTNRYEGKRERETRIIKEIIRDGLSFHEVKIYQLCTVYYIHIYQQSTYAYCILEWIDFLNEDRLSGVKKNVRVASFT